MWRLSVDKKFSAAHQLTNYNGPCENLHGHSWKVQTVVEGSELNESGLVIDFRELKDILKEIHDKFDHKYLNDLFEESPTSEFLSRYIFHYVKERIPACISLVEVSVWESENARATYFE